MRFEYVSEDADPTFDHCRHHVQFHRDYHRTRSDFSPAKLHIPTGMITIEEVIRFLILDLGVTPLTKNWKPMLAASEARFADWNRI